MPEVVTRYPESLIKELKDVGGKCGVGAPQEILRLCPADRFCSLPTGEICVYDLKNFKTMTQMNQHDWYEHVTGIPSLLSGSTLILMIIVFGIGMMIGSWLDSGK